MFGILIKSEGSTYCIDLEPCATYEEADKLRKEFFDNLEKVIDRSENSNMPVFILGVTMKDKEKRIDFISPKIIDKVYIGKHYSSI